MLKSSYMGKHTGTGTKSIVEQRLWSEQKAKGFLLMWLRNSIWICKTQLVGCLTIYGLGNQERPERLPEGCLLHFPTSKSLGNLKNKKQTNEKKGQKKGGEEGESMNTGAQDERQSPLTSWKGKLFSRDFTDKLSKFFRSLWRCSRCLYKRNILLSLCL